MPCRPASEDRFRIGVGRRDPEPAFAAAAGSAPGDAPGDPSPAWAIRRSATLTVRLIPKPERLSATV
jgi:hypothetical protein